MSLLQEAKHLLRLCNLFPKKRLGQNFVVDTTLLEKMISYATVTMDDVILEVGAGLGFLTRRLSKRCKRVIAVEVDPTLVKVLQKQLGKMSNVELVEGDILKVSVSHFDKLVSTPPYSISSSLLFWLLDKEFDCAVLTFQKEFAERLVAPVGSKEYGRLTVTTYYRTKSELLDYVSRDSFFPSPDIDSMVVRLWPRKSPFQIDGKECLLDLVRILFNQRNRKVRKAILPFLYKRGIHRGKAEALADTLSFHAKRVRALAPEDFCILANEIAEKQKQ
jgi:16S rRNA (adenine1518-N6/adenine1519-N6)-dimethyltransferase